MHIGTSGWVYPYWRGRFYPEDLAEPDWLGFYARYFSSVEINRSFYRLPTKAVFAHWRDATPAGFVFSVKAGRFISHMKKLKAPESTLPPLLDAVAGLGDKLGPLLFQLPPNWRVNPERLRAFLEALPRGLRVAFELRDTSWHNDAVLALLAEHNAAFCIYDLAGFESPRLISADFTYLRLHGPGAAYSGRYGRRALEAWAAWLARQPVDTAYVYFDNDEAAYAVRDAAELQKLLSG
ncbi:DUF72 domain-containing protein [Sulfuritortus calidifontis]|uniref:DUF72 domain-containing protein n=1 Tax=Sulfuritortus calidifontis TaxID=1914471 RepID=UPI0018D55E4A|nr:DUF72 domain-containing protein [Sulfuritortus calidifontis]